MRKLVIIFLLAVVLSGCSQIEAPESLDAQKESSIEADTASFLSAQEYTAIRQNVPYEPRNFETAILPSYPFCDDATGRRLTNFISNVTFHGPPGDSFTSPQDPAGEKFLHVNAIYCTRPYQVINGYQNYMAQLSAFEEFMEQYSSGYLAFIEHVDLTAKLMYGDDFKFHHGEQWTSKFGIVEYSELGGFYELGVFGMGNGPRPIMLSYAEYDDRYETVVVFPMTEEGRFVSPTFTPLNNEDLIAHCNELDRHYITIRKAEGGGLNYYVHRIADTDSQIQRVSEIEQVVDMATLYFDYLTSLGGKIETTASKSVGGGVVKHTVDELYYYLGDLNDDGVIDLAISAEESDGNGIEIYTYQDGQVTKLLSDRMPYSSGSEIFTLAKFHDTYGCKYLRYNSVGEWSFFQINKDGTLQAIFEEWLYDIDGTRLDTSATFDNITPVTFYGIEELEDMMGNSYN